jgi:hypothetical protein
MSARRGMCLAWLLCFLGGCPAPISDPPPPPVKPEIPAAPPRALGARAAGTEAAPRPDNLPGAPAVPLFPGPGLGNAPDAGGPLPDAEAAPVPDAGMAL